MPRANPLTPSAVGQLVWSPADPNLGIGIVTDVDAPRVHIQFFALQSERIYTTRGADPAVARYPISSGERVQLGDGEWRTVEAIEEGQLGLWHYRLDDGSTHPEAQLMPRVRDIGAKERLATLNLAHPESVRARLFGLRLEHCGARPGHAAVVGARAMWLPHQIDVAARALAKDPVRLLLADEVGLGKTVEAALIYAGLRHEGRARRILILTPRSLCIQWLGEVYRKTHELLVFLDEERIVDAAQEHPDLSCFEAYQRMVMAIEDLIENPALAEAAGEASWDLVVVDEAHHLRWSAGEGGNPGYQLVEQLAARSRHLLLLTATPMALDPAEYHALLRLLDPGRFGRAEDFETILSHQRAISNAGRQLQAVIDQSAGLDAKAAKTLRDVLGDDPDDVATLETTLKAKGKAAATPASQLMEGLRDRHGIAEFVVRNRRGPVGGLPVRKSECVGLEPGEAQEHLLEVGESLVIDLAKATAPGDEQLATVGRMLRALWATPEALLVEVEAVSKSLAHELEPLVKEVSTVQLDAEGLPTNDARLRWLVELLRRMPMGDKVLVFVESDVAAIALKKSLSTLISGDVAVFHKGLSPRDQDRQVAWFRDPGGPKVMLSTEAGGEGRNFQFCSSVVLYDLPWRPATVEQRIGRIDRVGQKNDVQVFVPYFKGGYEAAILKVMQTCIGVLDETVGGIDHQLEYVSGKLATLVLDEADAEAWKSLYRQTGEDIRSARQRIEAGVDPILDFSSFNRARAEKILSMLPHDLENQLQELVSRYAEHNRLELYPKGDELIAVDGGPSAASGGTDGDAYVATFSREKAIDFEEVEFLSFGHPLVEDALEWAREGNDVSAALALCRGFDKDGSVFLWFFSWELPADAPDAAMYLEQRGETVALDEGGRRQRELESLLWDPERPFDRMDPTPLKAAIDRWSGIVEGSYMAAQELAETSLQQEREAAIGRLSAAFQKQRTHLRRRQARSNSEADQSELVAMHEALEAEHVRLLDALNKARPRLRVALAVRLMRSARVSG